MVEDIGDHRYMDRERQQNLRTWVMDAATAVLSTGGVKVAGGFQSYVRAMSLRYIYVAGGEPACYLCQPITGTDRPE